MQPYVAAAVLAGEWSWLHAPALGLALLGFLLREPLTVVARHRLVWRRRSPQEQSAWRWAWLELAGIIVCFGLLGRIVPLGPLLALAAVGGAMSAAAVWMAIRNRQRSVVFQVVSAAGLSTTALLSALAAGAAIPVWAGWLWGVLTAHAAASILVVHARLRARAAAGAGAGGTGIAASAAQVLQLVAAVAAGWLAAPLLFSALANAAELWRLRSPQALREPLTRVGYRTLAAALTHMALAIYVLWPLARGSSE